ncbi:putative RNA-binding protein with PUA-like domain [Pontibacter ummariensis]|uniref:Predicted RNA-binding protein, contains PUA-like domain n=1 Tax=Pontibacter ummariensis TaxID=1610492 RepID=A0A239BBM3_9BACT|nr:EVE domain-containing protein [Pontibacter ummariensis]PRY16433.1 putative RNA-binding protein with PUA-like domain [Pontibacter ummariensis]SNS05069.1 Predicted RNA-binding protein, contains PUA-like domain [Pontibacter ummariensis]
MQHWLVKSEPEKYAWADLVRDGRTMWDGVRNYQARNNMQQMQPGDLVLYYHSVSEKAVVGIAKVEKAAYPDPTTDDPKWVVVDLVPYRAFKEPVTLQQIKEDKRLQDIALLRQSRLSVMPLKAEEFDVLLALGN